MIGFWRGGREVFLVQLVERSDWADWVRELLLMDLFYWWLLMPSKSLEKMLQLWVMEKRFVSLCLKLVNSWCQPAVVHWLSTEFQKKKANFKGLSLPMCPSSYSLISKLSTDHVSIVVVFEHTGSVLLCICLLRNMFYTALAQQRKHSWIARSATYFLCSILGTDFSEDWSVSEAWTQYVSLLPTRFALL